MFITAFGSLSCTIDSIHSVHYAYKLARLSCNSGIDSHRRWSFSALKTLKTCSRSTMNATCLAHLSQWHERQKLANIVGRIFVGRQNLSCVMEKLANFCWQTKAGQQNKIFQHVRKPSELSSRILDCDWWVKLFTNMESEWKDEDCFKLIALYELNTVLYHPSDRNYRNCELKRQKEWNCDR